MPRVAGVRPGKRVVARSAYIPLALRTQNGFGYQPSTPAEPILNSGQHDWNFTKASLAAPTCERSGQRLAQPLTNPVACTSSSTPSLLKSSNLESQAQALWATPSSSERLTQGATPFAIRSIWPVLVQRKWAS